jgi:hypothetical protein
MKKRNKHIGSSLEAYLKEEGVLEETRAAALKETLAASSASEGEGQNQQGRDGATHEYKPRGAESSSRSE